MEVKEAELRPERAALEQTIEALEKCRRFQNLSVKHEIINTLERICLAISVPNVPILKPAPKIGTAASFPGYDNLQQLAINRYFVVDRGAGLLRRGSSKSGSIGVQRRVNRI